MKVWQNLKSTISRALFEVVLSNLDRTAWEVENLWKLSVNFSGKTKH